MAVLDEYFHFILGTIPLKLRRDGVHKKMKVKVVAEDCISCGLCVNDVPEVFSCYDNEKAQAIDDEVAADLESDTKDAITSCPTDAIKKV